MVIAMNPDLQYFIELTEFRQTAPFDPSMMSQFRQRLMPEMLQDINDVITGRKTAEQIACESDDHDDSGDGSAGSSSEGGQSETKDDTRYAWRQSQVMILFSI